MSDDEDMERLAVVGPGTFTFSAVKPENLGASEYTLVTIVCDVSGSVNVFAKDLLKAIRMIIDACKKSPRSENLMIRLITFNDNIEEVHGFKELYMIDQDAYDDLDPGGCTALFDATYSGIGSVLTYSETLIDQDYDVNGAVYIITDGMDNRSSMGPSDIRKMIKEAIRSEKIESLISILVGLKDPNETDQDWADQVSRELDTFHKQAGLTQYIDFGNATAGRLAKLAEFVSKSVSSQSNALGSGSPSQPPSVTF
jgi:uncharacterized protein YegL